MYKFYGTQDGIHGFEQISYTEKLQKCELPTLKYRGMRGDMIGRQPLFRNLYSDNRYSDNHCSHISGLSSCDVRYVDQSVLFVYREALKDRLRAQRQGTRVSTEHSSHNPDTEEVIS